MAWVRVESKRDRLVNLDGLVHVEVLVREAHDQRDDARWAVEGLRRDGSSELLLEGSRAACDALLDELAEAVWASEVGGPDGPATGSRFTENAVPTKPSARRPPTGRRPA